MADSKLTALSELSVPATEDLTYAVDDPAGSPVSNKLTLARLLGLVPGICDGRLTTESGVPVSTADRTAQGTIYFTAAQPGGNRVCLYDGTRWKLYTFAERSLVLSALTSGRNYDVFLYDNAGSLTLELSAAWTNDTTRADALTTQDGVYVKSGAATRRYVGTIRTTGTTTTEDSAAKRFVWSHDNRALRKLAREETASSWTYSTASWRQANANAANQVEVVVGLAGAMVDLILVASGRSNINGTNVYSGIGEDSTTATVERLNTVEAAGNFLAPIMGGASRYPPVGYHYYTWLEKGPSGGATGLFAGTSAGNYNCGLIGSVEG